MYDFLAFSQSNHEMMKQIRRQIHRNPEIDRDLPMTTLLVEQTLDQLEISWSKYSNNGIVAELGSSDPMARIVALRADMDALQVVDEKTVEYKSQKSGCMHACGHDAHTAILLGAAANLKKIEDKLNGRVRLIFQPAEETDGGAREMIEFGALEGVEAIFGLHVDETLNTGVVGLHAGTVHAASNPFSIVVTGKGSHGASPEAGVDSIFIASRIIDGLQAVVSREIAATDSAVITVGKISGGTAANAICSSVIMDGILRTLGNDLRSFAKQRINEVVDATARAYRGTASICFVEGYPSFENDSAMVAWFTKLIDGSDVALLPLTKPSMGVEDFAYYAQKIPALFYRLGCRNEMLGIIHPAHGGFFDVDEECLVLGAMLQSKAAFEYLLTESCKKDNNIL